MRLMLGQEGKPSLLVSIADDYNKDSFGFSVINGRWEGNLTGNVLRIYYDYDKTHFKDETVSIEILTDNQQRLAGEYNEVFGNFHNESWVSPDFGKERCKSFDFEDDICF